jgi:hypothetical protein
MFDLVQFGNDLKIIFGFVQFGDDLPVDYIWFSAVW